jgi:hypothetical protein
MQEHLWRRFLMTAVATNNDSVPCMLHTLAAVLVTQLTRVCTHKRARTGSPQTHIPPLPAFQANRNNPIHAS